MALILLIVLSKDMKQFAFPPIVAAGFLSLCRLGRKGTKRRLADAKKALYRPMWQVYKYEFYGERELEEIGIVDDYQRDVALSKGMLKMTWEIIRSLLGW